jgi:hypothetical protein
MSSATAVTANSITMASQSFSIPVQARDPKTFIADLITLSAAGGARNRAAAGAIPLEFLRYGFLCKIR